MRLSSELWPRISWASRLGDASVVAAALATLVLQPVRATPKRC